MIGIVLVSHSAQLARGVKELADQMTRGSVKIAAAGGAADGTLGTNADEIRSAIEEAYSPEGVLVLMDLGSAVMSAEVAVESLDPKQSAHVRLSNGPLVEGAVIAAVEASTGKSLEECDASAVEAGHMQKLQD
jgi:dihydroxyacetone kinase phosphotransfer subunit